MVTAFQLEPRFHADLAVRVFGMDADGRPFSQTVRARNISDHGAKISGLDKRLKLGDTVGVQVGDRKARCTVIWTIDSGPVQKNEAGVKLVDGQACPWREERELQRAAGAAPILRVAPAAKENRKFKRRSIPFAIEIREVRSGAHLRANAADITGNGCYIETLQPFPAGTELTVMFRLSSEEIRTTAIVRTSHSGVGMGIEFTGLDDATQQRLQREVESMATRGGLRSNKLYMATMKQNA
jgi:hypothetical protein